MCAPRFFLLLLLLLAPASSRGQTILREYWHNLDGSSVANLTGAPAYPSEPTGRDFPTLFESPNGWGDNYGTRMRGYVTAPTTGNYTFWIAGDDESHLFLSTDENPGNARLIARVLNWTGYRVWEEPRDGNSAVQRSEPIPLVAGRKYYIESLQKEGGGGDHVSVGWRLPSGALERPIPGSRLNPFQILTTAPEILQQPAHAEVSEGQSATFSVNARGAEPMSYVWIRDGLRLEGERSPTLTIPVARIEDNGARFWCEISNAVGATNTSQALLTVGPERIAPVISVLHPPPQTSLPSFQQAEITFSEAVAGVDASDLLLNGQPATSVSGAASGPYVFRFEPIQAGQASLAFSANHGITDVSQSSNSFNGQVWSHFIDSGIRYTNIVISEFLAANENGLADETGVQQDWIELWNKGTAAVNLRGWSLSDDAGSPGAWVLPAVPLGPGQRLLVFASGEDRRTNHASLHTNFKLSVEGEYLGLFSPESPRRAVSKFAPSFPEQRPDHSFGLDPSGALRYFAQPTPRLSNTASTIVGVAPPPEFSVARGLFYAPFSLVLTTPLAEAQIRYTIDNSDPSSPTALIYNPFSPIELGATRVIRAAVFREGYLPSRTITHSYIFNLPSNRVTIPILSVATDQKNLTGPTGIIGIQGGTYSDGPWRALRAGDYHNPRLHGIAWERPVSAEWILGESNDGFQIDAGLRVQGSDYRRPRYMPNSKFSYRLYFRGDYGPSKLEYPLFGDSPLTEFDRVVLRAGHNDETNPFIRDELMRRLFLATGQVGAHGEFALYYLNGVYKGYYNITERIDKQFFQGWHGGENWDVLAQGLDPIDGSNQNFRDMLAFVNSRDPAIDANYQQIIRWLDVTNYIDYLLVNIYGANGDWPHNNWRAGREQRPGALWRWVIWDAEFAFGTFGRSVNHNTFSEELGAGSEIAQIWRRLRRSPEFRLAFADRVHKHFYNDGALTGQNVTNQFTAMQEQLRPVIPSMDTTILRTWIPQRWRVISNHFRLQNVFASSNAPVFSKHGGHVPRGHQLTMSSTAGTIYYTTDGSDPRTPYESVPSGSAVVWSGEPLALNASALLKARSLVGTNWSALTEASFYVAELASALRISEIMHNPPGGSAYEFLELWNSGQTPIDLTGCTLDGIDFAFKERVVLGPNDRLVLASNNDPAAFAARYPGVVVRGWFGANLSNSGEEIAIRLPNGAKLVSVTFGDRGAWPSQADGGGFSLELIDPSGDPDDPGNWRASIRINGSPGTIPEPPMPAVIIEEVLAKSEGGAVNDFIELRNTASTPLQLAGWRLWVNDRSHTLTISDTLQANGSLVLWADAEFSSLGTHLGAGLPDNGGSIVLLDASGNRAASLSYGPQAGGLSMALIHGRIILGVPTPGTENIAAPAGSVGALSLNEALANPRPGQGDWIELYNNSSLPVPLQGAFIAIPGSAARLHSPVFIEPRGYLLLHADELPGSDHLDFKLPADGTTISLHDPDGNQLDVMSIPSQAEGSSHGRLPDGSGPLTLFTHSVSPGSANYTPPASGLALNEVMAHNRSAFVDPFGSLSGWVELANTSQQPMQLQGWGLRFASGASFQFADPLMIAPGGHLVVWCDPLRSAASADPEAVNSGQSLNREGHALDLLDPSGLVVDRIEFGAQVSDLSIGRSTAGWVLLTQPTPAAANSPPASLGSVGSVRINEWLASADGESDWIELHNSSDLPVSLSGNYITDDPSLAGLGINPFPPLSFIGAASRAVFDAVGAERPTGSKLAFRLNAAGENLRLYSAARSALQTISYVGARAGESTGVFPDGGTAITSFAQSSSPGAANFLGRPLAFISKVVSSGPEAGVQIRALKSAINISGWGLSDDANEPGKIRLRNGLVLWPHTSLVVSQGYLASSTDPARRIALNQALPMQLHLSELRADGTFTGRRHSVVFTPAGVNAGYLGGGAAEFMLPGGDSSLDESLPVPAPAGVHITEIYPGSSELDVGYLELVRLGPDTNILAGSALQAKLEGSIEYLFPPQANIPPGGYALILSVDPQSAAAREFTNRFKLSPEVQLFGPFKAGSRSWRTDVRLLRPISLVDEPPRLAGYISYELSDQAHLGPIRWNRRPDQSLQKQAAGFWAHAALTPARPNMPGQAIDSDGDGATDGWEMAFGLDPFTIGEASNDTDFDGVPDLVEFRTGSNPLDPGDVLRLGVRTEGGVSQIQAVARPGRALTILASDSIEGPWEKVGEISSSVWGMPELKEWPIGPAPARLFYRLAAE